MFAFLNPSVRRVVSEIFRFLLTRERNSCNNQSFRYASFSQTAPKSESRETITMSSLELTAQWTIHSQLMASPIDVSEFFRGG